MLDYKGVIFDLDGTLLDSLKVWKKVNNIFFKEKNVQMPVDYEKKIASKTFFDSAKYTKEVCNLQDSEQDIIKMWEDIAYVEYKKNVKLKNGAYDYLCFLKQNNIKMGIATACDKKLYEVCLKNNKIYDFFDAIVDTSLVKRGKDFPDIYLLCAEKLGLEPKDIIVFEDIEEGIESAKKVGMKAYGVYNEENNNMQTLIQKSDDYITDFREMIL